jgi:putative ABC transport system substrate-binding protein
MQLDQLKRRDFITLLGGAAAAWPLGARAQQGPMPVIGFLGGADPIGYAVLIGALRSGLRDHGYIEGTNVRIEYRWAEGKYERLPVLAADLVHRKVDIIITQGTPAAFAAKQATTTIPIVMAIVGDPVDSGIVASYSRPGGNITGSSIFFPEMNAKRLELMKDLVPGLRRAGVLMNPDNPGMTTSVLRAMDEMAKAMDVKLQHVEVRRVDELDSAFAQAKSQIEAHTVIDDGLFIANAKRIAELAIRNRLPGIGYPKLRFSALLSPPIVEAHERTSRPTSSRTSTTSAAKGEPRFDREWVAWEQGPPLPGSRSALTAPHTPPNGWPRPHREHQTAPFRSYVARSRLALVGVLQ